LPHCVCKLDRASFTDYSKAARVRKIVTAYAGVVETNCIKREREREMSQYLSPFINWDGSRRKDGCRFCESVPELDPEPEVELEPEPEATIDPKPEA